MEMQMEAREPDFRRWRRARMDTTAHSRNKQIPSAVEIEDWS